MILTAVGASVCASGSQLCNGNNGNLIAKPIKKIKKINKETFKLFFLKVLLGHLKKQFYVWDNFE